jgi:hypothetical protein
VHGRGRGRVERKLPIKLINCVRKRLCKALQGSARVSCKRKPPLFMEKPSLGLGEAAEGENGVIKRRGQIGCTAEQSLQLLHIFRGVRR